jgi:hypothetical protein
MGRAGRAGVVVATVLVLAGIGLAAAGAADEPGEPVAARVPPPADAAHARRTVDALDAAGAVVAQGEGIVVETVTAPAASGSGAGSDALRLTLTRGPFQVRDLPIVVRVDGRVIGRARPGPDLSTAAVVSFDRSWVRPGAQVTWSYGDPGPPIGAGTITAVQP